MGRIYKNGKYGMICQLVESAVRDQERLFDAYDGLYDEDANQVREDCKQSIKEFRHFEKMELKKLKKELTND